jgi:peptidoglycan/xylan/chitin deacetylase (PgdA/CDA1 family)
MADLGFRPIASALLTAPLGTINGARTSETVAALTFDDGPDPAHTPGILDVLAARGVTATFFMIGHRASAHGALVRRIVSEGHEVGLHGHDHVPLPLLTARSIAERVRGGRRVLEDVAGQAVELYRPPHGAQTVRTYLLTRMAGLQVVGWTALCQDWKPLEIEAIAARAADRLTPGGILLLHDGVEPDVTQPEPPPAFNRAAMVAAVLDRTADRGFSFSSVTALTSRWPERRTLWFTRRARLNHVPITEGSRVVRH